MIKINHNIDQVQRELKKVAERKNMETNIVLDNFLKKSQTDIKTEWFSGQHGDRALDSKSGRAKNSWKIRKMFSDAVKKTGSLFSNVPYIETHETRTRRLDLRTWWTKKQRELEVLIRKIYR